MPAELDDIELRSVQLQQSHSRDSISNACDLRRVPTDKGDILVAIQGDLTKPAILTLHDLGLNCKSLVDSNPISLTKDLFRRRIDLHRILQLPNHASFARKFLCLPRHPTWTGRRCSDLPRRVSAAKPIALAKLLSFPLLATSTRRSTSWPLNFCS